MKKRSTQNRFEENLQKKLVILFVLILLAFIGLIARLVYITRENGDAYAKQVLSQQRYDSVTIPFKRGDILDCKGTKLAVSEKVYNVILDTKAVLDEPEYLEPTLEAIRTKLNVVDTASIREYIANNPSSRYYIIKKQMTYDEIAGFLALQEDTENNPNIKGIWFEDEYKRMYPGGSLASDVIGFTTSDSVGKYGLEEYYNDELSGYNGREYGYLDSDSNLERTTIGASDGNNIVTTIDANVQAIAEKYLKQFNDDYKDRFREGNGSNNTGCIIMDVNSGEILAMASYPGFDLNDTRNTDALIGRQQVDADGKNMGLDFPITEDSLREMDDETLYQNLNNLWKNFCIADTYEPGSVIKPFTVATGIETGAITGEEKYNCEGKLHVGDYDIKCHNRYGDGYLSISEAVERSCNVAMMYISMAIGKERFVDFQHIFNFGLKTNVDLAGETRTASLVYTKDSIGLTEMATNSFGQGFNVNMIQTITGFCSLINGGYYYEPHIVRKIVSPEGAVVKNIEPRVLKQTISPSTSALIREYCYQVVVGENGTGKTARPAGYSIGGKTGTAETLPRGNNEYVVSFMGYAPADDPQIAIYVVVDRPNYILQDDAKFATGIVRNILTEVLPYLNIYMTEELTEKETLELQEKELLLKQQEEEENPEEEVEEEEEIPEKNEIWKTFPIDPETGYAIDPDTGNYVDPITGAVIGSSVLDELDRRKIVEDRNVNDEENIRE